MIDILKKSDFFKQIEADNIKKILNCVNYTIKNLNKDTYNYELYKGFKAFIVLSGVIDLISLDEYGTEIIDKRYIKPDSFAFNFDANFNRILKPKTNSQILALDIATIYDAKSKTCKYRSLLMENIIFEMERQLSYLSFKMNLYSKSSLREKILIFLYYEAKAQNNNIIKLKYTREDLAKFLACNRSALSREFSRMEKDEIIKIKSNFIELLNYKIIN